MDGRPIGQVAPPMKRQVPEFRSDEEAAAFLEQDLSDLDFTQFKPAHFEFEKKAVQINMLLPKSLLDAGKERSAARGIPHTRFIREALEKVLPTSGAPSCR